MLFRSIAFFSDDPEKLAKFYTEVIGFEVKARGIPSVWITDGYLDIALLKRADNSHAHLGLNHFGITMEEDEKAGIYERLKAGGHPIIAPPKDRSYVEDYGRDVDGNKFDLSTSGVKVREGKRSVFKNPSEKEPA